VPANPLLPSVGATPSAGTTAAQPGDAIVAMTNGAQRTGSAVVVAPDLVVTSTHVVKLDKSSTTAIMTASGELLTFEVVASDKALGLVLLRVQVPDSKVLPWGKGRELIADDKVVAYGMGGGNREVMAEKGVVKSPSAATGNDLMLTDIRIDPLVEGGALIGPDGKLSGIIVSRGQGQMGGNLGWAVTSEAVRRFVDGIQAEQAAARLAAEKKAAVRWVKVAFLAAFLGLWVFLGYRFRRWYKAMEAREEAEAAAHEAEESLAAEEALP
jgi:S1-C subfamily serine protease